MNSDKPSFAPGAMDYIRRHESSVRVFLAACALAGAGCSEITGSFTDSDQQAALESVSEQCSEALSPLDLDQVDEDGLRLAYERIESADFGIGTIDEMVEDTAAFMSFYGINLQLAREEVVFGSGSAEPLPSESHMPLFSQDLRNISRNLLNLEPELVREISPTLVLTSNIETTRMAQDGESRTTTGAMGLSILDENKILIDVVHNVYPDRTLLHEIEHLLAFKVICEGYDAVTDKEFSLIGSHEYAGRDEIESIKDYLYRPNREREFASKYGGTVVEEDRAEIFLWTINDRGLILPGDPDYESPLRKKQELLVSRIEQLVPGFTTSLEELTRELRIVGRTELDRWLENPYESDQFGAISEILKSALDQQRPVEQLRGAVLIISQENENEYKAIENPIVVRDEDGQIYAVAWADPLTGLEGGFFYKDLMSLRNAEDTDPRIVSDEMTFSKRSEVLKFDPAILMIGDVLASEFDDGRLLTESEVNSLWPVYSEY
jgi:hypothetical protein